MNFSEMYEKCITVKKYTSVVYDPDILIPNLYSYDQLPVSQTELDAFLHLLAGGNLFCEDLFAFSFQPMDCCLLLYTTAGSGTLTIKDRTVSLTEKQLLFFDCDQPFSLQGAILPWSFKLFFISGEPLHLFRRLFHAHTAPCFALSDFSPLPDEISSLLGISTDVSVTDFLRMQSHINRILTALCLSAQPDTPVHAKNIPSYLVEMKDSFDHHCSEAFSLDIYQERYGISKYRLCREFSANFGQPPLRYLNEKRLRTAKEMLLTSDMNVQTISSLVGFDNVNHFINLFKKYVGMTPNAFRQTVQEDQPVLHSPAQ